MQSPRLLLIDDDTQILRLLTGYFQAKGFSVDSAGEREEAEALLTAHCYQCVITDLELTSWHGAEGLQILDELRAIAPTVRTVLFTGHSSPAIEEHARRHGVDAIVRKPAPLGELEAIVLELLDGPPAAGGRETGA